MKIYLTSDNSGGHSLEAASLFGTGYHLTCMPAFILNHHNNICLVFYYDILGKNPKTKDPKHSILKKGEIQKEAVA